jgi:hypothetical protein
MTDKKNIIRLIKTAFSKAEPNAVLILYGSMPGEIISIKLEEDH